MKMSSSSSTTTTNNNHNDNNNMFIIEQRMEKLHKETKLKMSPYDNESYSNENLSPIHHLKFDIPIIPKANGAEEQNKNKVVFHFMTHGGELIYKTQPTSKTTTTDHDWSLSIVHKKEHGRSCFHKNNFQDGYDCFAFHMYWLNMVDLLQSQHKLGIGYCKDELLKIWGMVRIVDANKHKFDGDDVSYYICDFKALDFQKDGWDFFIPLDPEYKIPTTGDALLGNLTIEFYYQYCTTTNNNQEKTTWYPTKPTTLAETALATLGNHLSVPEFLLAVDKFYIKGELLSHFETDDEDDCNDEDGGGDDDEDRIHNDMMLSSAAQLLDAIHEGHRPSKSSYFTKFYLESYIIDKLLTTETVAYWLLMAENYYLGYLMDSCLNIWRYHGYSDIIFSHLQHNTFLKFEFDEYKKRNKESLHNHGPISDDVMVNDDGIIGGLEYLNHIDVSQLFGWYQVKDFIRMFVNYDEDGEDVWSRLYFDSTIAIEVERHKDRFADRPSCTIRDVVVDGTCDLEYKYMDVKQLRGLFEGVVGLNDDLTGYQDALVYRVEKRYEETAAVPAKNAYVSKLNPNSKAIYQPPWTIRVEECIWVRKMW